MLFKNVICKKTTYHHLQVMELTSQEEIKLKKYFFI